MQTHPMRMCAFASHANACIPDVNAYMTHTKCAYMRYDANVCIRTVLMVFVYGLLCVCHAIMTSPMCPLRNALLLTTTDRIAHDVI